MEKRVKTLKSIKEGMVKNNPKKSILIQSCFLLLDFMIVKGGVLFVQEKTGYSLLFPIFTLLLISLLQFGLFFCAYFNEVFKSDTFFLDKSIINNQEYREYQVKQSQVYVFEIMRLVGEFIFLFLLGIQKEVCIIILSVNGIAFLIINYIYTEIWAERYLAGQYLFEKKIIRNTMLICLILLFQYPKLLLISVIGVLLIIQIILNKLHIKRDLYNKDL